MSEAEDRHLSETEQQLSDMEQQLPEIEQQLEVLLRELIRAGGIGPGQFIVFGTSTSEIVGARIGTAGNEAAAAHLFSAMERVRRESGFYPVYQCCEHLNRALVVERELLNREAGLEEVSVVPMPKAGGSMAAYAYRQFREPCVVERVSAHAGIDIGGTLIGMHLRQVAVPLRPSIRQLGQAHVTMAYTRPKLIGGERAVYVLPPQPNSGHCN